MDKLLNEFTVIRPIEETWKVLTDIERIAPCMPGATLEEIAGDVYRGTVKVKLGAIATAFKGQATFIERDDTNHRAVLKAEGRDTTGKGNAAAEITAHLEEVDPATTKVVVETDLHITGKVAQFGRGIMGDVSKKLINQFATNLNTMIAQPESAAALDVDTSATAVSPDATDEWLDQWGVRRQFCSRRCRSRQRRSQDQRPRRCPHRVVRCRRLGDPQAHLAADRWPGAAVDHCASTPP